MPHFTEQFAMMLEHFQKRPLPKIPKDVLSGRSEVEAMNALQNHGIVSDNCVTWDDVGNRDEAIAWLRRHPQER